MKYEWHSMKLKDCCDFQEGYVNPPQTHPEYFDGEIKWIRAVDLNDGYVYSTSRTLSRLGFESAKKSAHFFPPDSIVISKSGTIGRLGIIKDFMCGNRATINIRPKENVDLFYLFYFLRSRQKEFPNLAVGSVQKNLYISILEQVEILLPCIAVQREISSILKAVDDKIENNNKINANIQQQAQAIFKSWFVDFEPFQDGEFVESEFGLIPKGWSVGRLADICTYGKDKIAVSELTPENYFSTENMLANKGGYTSAASLPNVLQTTRCVPGDTLISNIRPYFKKIVYCTMKAGCSTDVLCLRPKHSKYSTYLYNLAYSDAFFDYMVAGSKGTKMPRGDKQQIMGYPVILPPDEVIAKFHEFADAVLKKIRTELEENKKLTVLRDSLLPKLMNGEIEIDGI